MASQENLSAGSDAGRRAQWSFNHHAGFGSADNDIWQPNQEKNGVKGRRGDPGEKGEGEWRD